MSRNETAWWYFLPVGIAMNDSRQVSLLREKLQLRMTVHQSTLFMNDGAPCHQSKVVKSFLVQQEIRILDQPGNSPGLNPTANLWSLKKSKFAEKQPSSLLMLQHAIKQVWVKMLMRNKNVGKNVDAE